MAATVSIEILLETAKAEQESEQTRKKLIADFQATAKAGTQGFKEFAQKSAQELQKLSNIAKQNAEKAARETAAKWNSVASNAIGIFGDLKDVFGMVGGAALGMSESTFKAVQASADLAEKGAMIGMSFGPLGALIGGVSGALISLAKEARDAKPALDELFKGREGMFSTGAVGAGAEIIWDQIFGNTEDLDEKEKAIVAALKRKKEIDADVAAATKKSQEQKKLYAEMGDDFSGPVVTESLDKQIKNRQALAKLNEDEAKKRKDAAVKAEEEEGKAVLAQMKKDYAAKEKADKEYADKWLKKNQAETAYVQMQKDAEIAIKDEIYQADLALFDLQQRLRLDDLNAERAIAAEKKAIFDQQQAERIAGFTILTDQMMTLTQAVTGQISDNIEAGNKAFGSMGIAARRGISEVLKSFAKQWTAKAFGEIAESLASLAIGDFRGAGLHALAATEYGVAAAAAGAGGARAARKANGGQSSTSSAGGGGLGRNSGSSAPTTTVQTPTIVNIQSLTPGDQRAWEYAQQAIAKANRGGR